MIFEQSIFPADATASEKLGLMMMGYRLTQLLYVAAKLGLADCLVDGPKSADEIASLTGAHPEHLFRLLRGLSGVGVFTQNDDGAFAQNDMSALLCSSHPGSVRDSAIRHGAEWSWLPWGSLLHSVCTGEPAFDHALGASHWEYMHSHAEAREGFSNSMAESTAWIATAVVNAYTFPAIGHVIDVGGGAGAMLAAILLAHPGIKGTLLDQAAVVDQARGILSKRGVLERCDLIGGNFFAGVPAGGDVYILKRIIHDWDDRHAVQLLRNCREAMGERGRLLIIDRIMPEKAGPSPIKIVDINMMVLYRQARERTLQEFQTLLAQAGLQIRRVFPLHIPAALIEAAGYSMIEGTPK